MKKILTFLILITIAFASKAQNKDLENKLIITLDWKTGNITHDLKPGNKSKRIRPKVGSYITIKVINLPEDYKASGEVEFENGNIEGGSVFSGFFKPEGNNNTGTPPKTDETDKKEKEEEKKIDSAAQEKKKKIDIASQAEVDRVIEEKNSKTIVEIKKIAGLNNSKLDKETKDKIENLVAESKRAKKVDINNLINSLEIGNVDNLLRNKNIISDALFSNPTNKRLLDKAIEDYNYQQRLIKIAYENIKQKDTLKDEVIRLKDSIINAYSNQKDSLRKITDTPKIKSQLTTPIFDIQVPNSDISNIKVAIKKDGKTVNEIPLSYYNKNGYKIDFSTGFFHTKLQDQEYEKVNKLITNTSGIQTSVDSVYQVKQKDKGKGKIAIGILAHYYPRFLSYFNIGISGGFSYQTETKVLSYLLGSSLLLGNQQRFIASFGAAFGRVKELDENFFKLNTDYHKSVLNKDIELPMSDKLKTSFFFGISYNLGTINSTKSVKRNF